jgi:dUTP pyrophosphatase
MTPVEVLAWTAVALLVLLALSATALVIAATLSGIRELRDERAQEERGQTEVPFAYHDVWAQPPSYAHPGDAGADICYSGPDMVLEKTYLAPTGLSVAIPDGFVGLICPRSGLATRGVTVTNAPGIIDSGYRGEIKVNLINLSDQPVNINHGDRIAQLLIVPVERAVFVRKTMLDKGTDRGENGHGSTGA